MSAALPPSPVPSDRSSGNGLVLNLGRRTRLDALSLERGDGPLARLVQATADAERGRRGIAPGTEIVPVVVLYRLRRSDYTVVSGGSPGERTSPPGHLTEAPSGERVESEVLSGRVSAPLVVRLGRIDSEALAHGAGRWREDLEETLKLVRPAVGPDSADRVVVSMVVVYTQDQDDAAEF